MKLSPGMSSGHGAHTKAVGTCKICTLSCWVHAYWVCACLPFPNRQAHNAWKGLPFSVVQVGILESEANTLTQEPLKKGVRKILESFSVGRLPATSHFEDPGPSWYIWNWGSGHWWGLAYTYECVCCTDFGFVWSVLCAYCHLYVDGYTCKFMSEQNSQIGILENKSPSKLWSW